MWENIKSADSHLLLFINGMHSPGWDTFMTLSTGKLFWLPFYCLLLGYLIWKYKHKSILLFIMIALLITTADQFASTLMKPLVARLRPCHDQSLIPLLYLPKGCGGLYGFISSHAANSFALAGFIFFLCRNAWLTISIFIWAILISYSRIYLGAHFPSDILGGILAGLVFGWGYAKAFLLLVPKFYKTEHLPIH